MSKIIQNAIFAPELDKYICSRNTHDYVGIKFPDDKEYDIDGGPSYLRRAGNLELKAQGRIVEFSLTDESPSKEVIDKLLWGHRGIDGLQPLTFRPIRFLTKDHIAAILKLDYINPLVREVAEYWVNTHEVEATEVQPQKLLT